MNMCDPNMVILPKYGTTNHFQCSLEMVFFNGCFCVLVIERITITSEISTCPKGLIYQREFFVVNIMTDGCDNCQRNVSS